MTADAKIVWRKLAPILDRMGVLTKLDLFNLKQYCSKYARWEVMRKFVEKNGEFQQVPLSDINQMLPQIYSR